MLFQAHRDDGDAVKLAQSDVMQRYSAAAYRYLLKVLADPDAADEVFQRFALSFVQGGFRHADPRRGRFRDYLKVSLLRLVSDHRRTQARGPERVSLSAVQLAADDSRMEQEWERDFVASICDELLSRAWRALQTIEDRTGSPLYTVLQCRARRPDANSAELASELTERLQPEQPLTSTGVRKTLQRAREKFSDLLLDEVIDSLGDSERESVEQEIIGLGLHPYCGSAFRRRYG